MRPRATPNAHFSPDKRLGKADRIFVDARFEGLVEHLSALGAKVTSLAVADARNRISSEFADWADAEDCLTDIQNTLRRELNLTTLLVLSDAERKLYVSVEPHFGSDVATKFPTNAAFEIDEAAKCMALGRSTAGVFHLMRVMEIGIGAVRQWLNIPDPIKLADRNWGKILEKIKAEMERRTNAKAWASPADRDLCEAAYVSLDAVKTAWRNPTMHIENKYVHDEAEHIFISVRGFMKKIASRMDEEGNPRA